MFVSMIFVQFERKCLGVPSFQLKMDKNVNGQIIMVQLVGIPVRAVTVFM